MTNDITTFCDLHSACTEGREWALANCRDMAEAWDKAQPKWLVWIATRPGVLDDKTMRLFAAWCARRVQHLMTDKRSLRALDAAEAHARGEATDEQLAAAWYAAWYAAWGAKDAKDAAWYAARAAWYAAWGAKDAKDAAWCAASAAGDAAWAAWAARDAAWYAARAARDAAWAAQAHHLRSMVPNPFREVSL